MLQYLEKKGISKYKFYKETGLSNGFLDKGENIGSDKCEIILSHYPDIRAEWLVTGRGPMVKEELKYQEEKAEPAARDFLYSYSKPKPDHTKNTDDDLLLEYVEENERMYSQMRLMRETMDAQAKTIDSLEKTVYTQDKLIERLEKLLDPKSGGKTVSDAPRSIRSTPRQLDPKE